MADATAVATPPQNTPAPSVAEIPQQLKEALEKSNVTPEQYSALIQSGTVLPVAGAKLDELPPSLRSAVEDYARTKAQEAASITKDQLHPTLEKLRQDNAAVKQMMEEERKKVQDAEAQKIRSQEEEERKKKGIEEQMELLRNESRKAMEQFSEQAKAQIGALEQQLAIERLTTLRERLISEAQGKLISDMVPDPRVMPVTPEQLQMFVEKAKQTYLELTAKAVEEYQKAQQVQQAQQAQQQLPSPGFPALPQFNPRPAQTTGFPVFQGQQIPSQVAQPMDLSNVASATRSELDKMKDEALRRFGF